MRLEFARAGVRFPAGLRCVFSSDPAVGAEREENLIRNDPDKSEFTIRSSLLCQLIHWQSFQPQLAEALAAEIGLGLAARVTCRSTSTLSGSASGPAVAVCEVW